LKNSALTKTVVLLVSLLLIGLVGRAQSPPSEYQIKAAFIYNFARFVEWPTQSYGAPDSPMIVGLLGENDFGDNLAQIINGKVIKGHPLQFKEFKSLAEATNCQVLFISKSEQNDFPKIITQLQGNNILTVSDGDNFIGAGGMIDLVIVDQKIRFQINDEAAKKAGLTISSKLLSLSIK
jgi:hypothetical protein